MGDHLFTVDDEGRPEGNAFDDVLFFQFGLGVVADDEVAVLGEADEFIFFLIGRILAAFRLGYQKEPPADAPPDPEESAQVQPVKGPNISALPEFDPLPERISAPVLLRTGDDVSTDEISPAGARALPLRSNIAALSEFTFTRLDETYPQRAAETGQHVVVGGRNYGQGSSREHAAITPRYLGLRVVLARSFARIHWQNLVNFGILPLEFAEESGYDAVAQGDELRIEGLREAVRAGGDITVRNITRGVDITARHSLSARQVEVVIAGGVIPELAESSSVVTR